MLTTKYPSENLFRVRINRNYFGFGRPKNKIKVDFFIPDSTKKINLSNIEPMNRDQPFLIPGPGEYEIGGTQISSVGKGYWEIITEGWRICWLSSGWKKPDAKKVDRFGQLDLVFLNLEGSKKEAKKAMETVQRLSPKGVILGYKIGKEFLDKVDREDIKPTEKVKVKQSDLTEEGIDYFALN